MKIKLLSAILALCLICSALSGCGQAYTVRLNENYPGGKTGELSASSAKAIEEATPVRDGYIFEGWYKDANLTEPWNAATDKLKSDLTLYAAWDKDTGDAISEPGNDKDFSRLRTPGSQEDAYDYAFFFLPEPDGTSQPFVGPSTRTASIISII